MPYIPTVWVNKPDTTTPVSADNLNKLEQAMVLASEPVSYNNLLDKPTLLTIGSSATTAKAGNYVPAWTEITGKPATFAPIIGTTATTAKAGDYAPTWEQVTGKPTLLTIGTTATTAKAGNWTPPNASYNTYGLIKIGNETPQTAEMNTVTLTAGRTYAVQVNANGNAVVNVPWVNTTYTLPNATTTARGGVFQAVGVEDSSGEDLLAVKNTLNELLASLRLAGIMT